MDIEYAQSLKKGDLFRYNCRSPVSISVALPNGGQGTRMTPMFKSGSIGVFIQAHSGWVTGLFDPSDLMPDFQDLAFHQSLMKGIVELWQSVTGKKDVYPIVHDCQLANTDPYGQ